MHLYRSKIIQRKFFMKKFILIIVAIFVIIIICESCDSSGSSSYQSDNSGGRYGYGRGYDDDVDFAADAFGTDSDSVNDLYGALGEAME